MELSSGSRPRPPLDSPIPAPWPGLCAALGPLDPMKPNPPAAPADPVLLFIAVAWLVAEALAALLIVALAVVLTIAGWRPSPAPVRAATARGVADPDAHHPAASAPVRAAGLARSGRRVELLQALAVVP